MGVYETSVRGVWRSVMRVAESRIDRVAELGRPLLERVGSEQPPVLAIAGYGNSAKAMSAIGRSFERDGFRAFAFTLPEFGFGSARADAQVILGEVARIKAETGAFVVDILGHSRNGPVSRWAQELDQLGDVGRVVTLNSANGGLHMGAFDRILGKMLPDGMQQIRRSASLITDLEAIAPKHDVIAVGTTGIDGILVPAGSARISGKPWIPVDDGRRLGVFSKVGHYGVLRDDTAFEAVRGAFMRPR